MAKRGETQPEDVYEEGGQLISRAAELSPQMGEIAHIAHIGVIPVLQTDNHEVLISLVQKVEELVTASNRHERELNKARLLKLADSMDAFVNKGLTVLGKMQRELEEKENQPTPDGTKGKECECQFIEEEGSWHFERKCPECGSVYLSLHCEHDGNQGLGCPYRDKHKDRQQQIDRLITEFAKEEFQEDWQYYVSALRPFVVKLLNLVGSDNE